MVQKKSQRFTGFVSWWIVYLAVATALISGAIYLYSFWRVRSTADNPAPAPVEKIKSIAALGRLEPEGGIIRLSVPNSLEGTRIAQVLVKEGDSVRQDQAIAILDSNRRRRMALEKALADVEVAKSRLAQVKAGAKSGDLEAQRARIANLKAEREGQLAARKAALERLRGELEGEQAAQKETLERLKAELQNATTDCDRFELLYREGALAESSRDRTCLLEKTLQKQVNEARVTLKRIVSSRQKQIREIQEDMMRTNNTLNQQQEAARATLDSLAEVRDVDVKLLQAQLNSAIAAAKAAQEDLDLTSIKSPINGKVLKVHVRPGEVVDREGIAEIGQIDEMYVVAEVYETDITKIRSGQKATITSPVFPGKLEGEVSKIGLQVNKQNVFQNNPTIYTDNKVIEVKIRLNSTSSQKAATLSNLQVQVVIFL
ncbi:MAG: ABC exporter membrane fusion protein [Microcoleus sp.]